MATQKQPYIKTESTKYQKVVKGKPAIKPQGGKKVAFDPSTDTPPAPQGQFKGASAQREIGARVGYTGDVCNNCVREQKAARKRICPIGYSWVECFKILRS